MNKGDKTVYQYGSFEPTLDASYMMQGNTFKLLPTLTSWLLPPHPVVGTLNGLSIVIHGLKLFQGEGLEPLTTAAVG
jgi:hypothetical protein